MAYPLGLYFGAALTVVVGASIAASFGMLNTFDAVGLSASAMLIAAVLTLVLGGTWISGPIRVRYCLRGSYLLTFRDETQVDAVDLRLIQQAYFVDQMGWMELAFSYPWPRFPRLVVVQDGLVHELPRVAVWGRELPNAAEEEIGRIIGHGDLKGA